MQLPSGPQALAAALLEPRLFQQYGSQPFANFGAAVQREFEVAAAGEGFFGGVRQLDVAARLGNLVPAIPGQPAVEFRAFHKLFKTQQAGIAEAHPVAGSGAVHVGIRATGNGEGHREFNVF